MIIHKVVLVNSFLFKRNVLNNQKLQICMTMINLQSRELGFGYSKEQDSCGHFRAISIVFRKKN